MKFKLLEEIEIIKRFCVSVTLVMLIISNIFSMAVHATQTNETEDVKINTSEEKIYSSLNENDDFADNRVIVVIKNSESLSLIHIRKRTFLR